MADGIERDSLELLLGLKVAPTVQQIDGRTYAIHPAYNNNASKLEAISDPQIKTLEVSSLEAVKDLIAAEFESGSASGRVEYGARGDGGKPAGVLLHVVSHDQVNLVSLNSDKWGRRDVIVSAKLPQVTGFQFGKYYDHDEFTVAVLSQFVEPKSDALPQLTTDRDYLVRIAANITNEAMRNSEDDGITQIVTVKKGIALKGGEALRNRLKLAPYRTFREVEQPISEFIFRLKQDREEQVPTLALFEADGGAWKLDAVKNIAAYFKFGIGAVEVIA
jgi:hypothetical protein